MNYVKLTNRKMCTYGNTKWVIGEWKEVLGNGKSCDSGWLHCYGANTEHQASLLAVLLNPIHANVKNPRLWLIDVDGKRKEDNGLKFGFKRMRLLEELPLPKVNVEQQVKFAILCAKHVHHDPSWLNWADGWLSGQNRSQEAAETVRVNAWTARAAAAEEASWAAAAAANAASGASAATAAGITAAWVTDSKIIDLGAIAEKAHN